MKNLLLTAACFLFSTVFAANLFAQKTCRICGTHDGIIKCETCRGFGRLPNRSDNCWNCGGSGKEKCGAFYLNHAGGEQPENTENDAETADFEASELSAEAQKFVGTWTATVFEQGQLFSYEWTLLADGSAFYSSGSRSTWKFEGGVIFEKLKSCAAARGQIEWLSDKKFRLTILENCNDSYRGVQRIYKKKEGDDAGNFLSEPAKEASQKQIKICHCCAGKGRYTCAGCDGRKGQYFDEWNGERYVSNWHDCSVCMGSGDGMCACCGGLGKTRD